ncbi:hypothetical protein M413DRAFT_9099 [Hebeloma cylindrosporum]|uniref:Uncharacterized protein n=1 Tax=Hebeloma cylindrosporum TaxID=76867 RepID=A0A0C3CL38_HEBCY|nr:hypothetical protein M413DRAFT_9099 [Hebeloma cylindrosporum h7]
MFVQEDSETLHKKGAYDIIPLPRHHESLGNQGRFRGYPSSRQALKIIQKCLGNEKPDVTGLIQTLDALNDAWGPLLEEVQVEKDVDLLTRWDESTPGLEGKAIDSAIKLESKKPGGFLEISLPNLNVHAECRLLSYHLQNPDIQLYHYFGGSKLSCHGCGTFFSAFNAVAESFNVQPYFTKGCHDKIYLQWLCPSLLSHERRIQLRGAPSLDDRVQEQMRDILERIGESTPSPPESDSIGDSHEVKVNKPTALETFFARRLSKTLAPYVEK